jgi:hypothetical protein
VTLGSDYGDATVTVVVVEVEDDQDQDAAEQLAD